MTPSDWINLFQLIVAVIAILISIGSLWKASQASRTAQQSQGELKKLQERQVLLQNEQAKLEHAQVENQIHQSISFAKNRVEDIGIGMSALATKNDRSDDEQAQLAFYTRALLAAMEGEVNAYEQACGSYLDGKIDKVRFKRRYIAEIRNLFNNTDYREEFFHNASTYHATMKVFREWDNLEE